MCFVKSIFVQKLLLFLSLEFLLSLSPLKKIEMSNLQVLTIVYSPR